MFVSPHLTFLSIFIGGKRYTTVTALDVCAVVLLNPDISSCADTARYCIMGTITTPNILCHLPYSLRYKRKERRREGGREQRDTVERKGRLERKIGEGESQRGERVGCRS